MRYILSLMLVAFLAFPAYAAYTGPGAGNGKQAGFKGPMSGSQAETVAQALKLPDDARVTLTGKIVSQLSGSKDEFMFRDDSGEMQVEISPKVFRQLNGVDVTPDTVVRISGKMDKDFAKNPELEVRFIEIVK